MWHESDIEGMLLGLGGVQVIHGTEGGFGTLDAFDEAMLQGLDTALVGRMIAITVRTNAFPTLKIKGAITADGISYTVRSRFAIDDGALTRLLCQKA